MTPKSQQDQALAALRSRRGIGIGALNMPATALLFILPLWLGTTFATARTVYHYSTQRRARELERLVDRLAALAGELGDAAPRPRVLPP